jgi:tRNA pseudouridine13 synthase
MYILKQTPEDFIVEEIPSFKTKEKGEYCYFLLEKKDYDTEKVIYRLSEYFNIQRKNFSYAGNKDRHAITSQYCSVKGRIKDMDFRDYKITIIGYGDTPISLGELKGNKFIITLRDVKEKPKKTDSIINYFDEQRFGKHNLEIGLSILRKDFKKVCELIDFPDVKEQLSKNEKDYVGAMRKVPFKILSLYIHSVQSWLWNEVAAEYIKLKIKKKFESKYNHGIFIFPDKKQESIQIPLVSFDTEFEDKKIKELYEKILSKEKINLRDFIIRQIPDITPMGNTRELVAEVKNMEIGELEKDELNEEKKKIKISFELGKGSYATIVIRKIFS